MTNVNKRCPSSLVKVLLGDWLSVVTDGTKPSLVKLYSKVTFLRDPQEESKYGDHSYIRNGDAWWLDIIGGVFPILDLVNTLYKSTTIFLNILNLQNFHDVYFFRDFVQQTVDLDLIDVAATKAAQMAEMHSSSVQFVGSAAPVSEGNSWKMWRTTFKFYNMICGHFHFPLQWGHSSKLPLWLWQ